MEMNGIVTLNLIGIFLKVTGRVMVREILFRVRANSKDDFPSL